MGQLQIFPPGEEVAHCARQIVVRSYSSWEDHLASWDGTLYGSLATWRLGNTREHTDRCTYRLRLEECAPLAARSPLSRWERGLARIASVMGYRSSIFKEIVGKPFFNIRMLLVDGT